SVPDGTSHRLRRPPRPPQTPVRPYVLVLVARDDDRLTEYRHHQRVTGVGDRGDKVDEVPAGAVGGGHFAPEGAVVGWSRHQGPQWLSAGVLMDVESDETSLTSA